MSDEALCFAQASELAAMVRRRTVSPLEIVRAVFLKGSGLDALWPQFLTLLVMAVGVVWFASTRFHKTVR